MYGTHAGLSSVVMSEAPFALFSVWGLSAFFRAITSEAPGLAGLLESAAVLAIAGGFRQEAWQLTGILALYLLWRPRTRRYAVPFAMLGLNTFALWDLLNALDGGGWFNALLSVGRSKSHEVIYRHFDAVANLFIWVWIFVRSPGLVISTLASTGLLLALRHRLRGDLALIAILLVGPYVILSVIRPQWRPQQRYTLLFVILLLPYAAAATRTMIRPPYGTMPVVAGIY